MVYARILSDELSIVNFISHVEFSASYVMGGFTDVCSYKLACEIKY